MSKKKNLFGQKRRPLSVYQLTFVLIIGLGIISVSLLQATPANAHALLVKSDPAALAVLQSPPDRVTLVFSEKLNTKLSNVRVLDRNATRIDLGDSFVEPNDPYQMSVGVNPIVGVYAVLWTSASAEDGHTLKGSFTFSVAAPTPTAAPSSSTGAMQTTQTQGPASSTNPPGTSAPTITPSGTGTPGVRPTPTPVPSEPGIVAPPTELPGSTSSDDMSGMDMSEGLSTTNIVLLLLTWLMQFGLVAWLGGAFFLGMIIGPGLRANGADWLWSARRTATARLVVLTRIGAVFIVIGIVGRLFEEALSISNGDWSQALSNTTIDGVINGSSYGFLSVTTIEAAVVGFCLSLAVPLYRLRPRSTDAQSVARSEKAWRRTLAIMRGELLIAALGTLTLAGSGHAAAVADITIWRLALIGYTSQPAPYGWPVLLVRPLRFCPRCKASRARLRMRALFAVIFISLRSTGIRPMRMLRSWCSF